MAWEKDKTIAAIKEYFESVELTTDSEKLRNTSGRNWRVATRPGVQIAAYMDCEKLRLATDAVLQNKYVSENFVRTTIENRIGDGCILQVSRGEVDNGGYFENLLASFTRAIRCPINVYMTVYGGVITERIKVGRYEFIPGDQFDTLELGSVPPEMRSGIKERLWCDQGHVCITVETCDAAKARELIVPDVQWLECVIRTFIDNKVHDFGVTSFDFGWAHNTLAISKGGSFANFNSQMQGCSVAFDLIDLFEKKDSLRLIVERLGRDPSELTSFQKCLKRAIYLVGLSRKISDVAVAYFLCVSALEVMLVSKGSPYVNPGVAYQINEALCLLLSAPQNRRSLFDHMQIAYGKRSAVAHGSASDVSRDELFGIQRIVRDAVVKFLTDERLAKIKDVKDIGELLKDIKFGKKEGA